jgi:putative transposase
MSLKGDYWDNALVESFVHTLNVELIHGKVHGTLQEAKTTVFDYIKIFYNRKHCHSYFVYLSPVDLEK